MAATATVTADTGPGIQATALVLTDVTSIQFDYAAGMVFIYQGSVVNQFSLEGVTTITTAVSSGNYTVTIS